MFYEFESNIANLLYNCRLGPIRVAQGLKSIGNTGAGVDKEG